MVITLDGKRIQADVRPGTTLRALVEQARRICETDRIVVEVRYDGEVLAGDTLDERLAQTLGDIGQVDFASARPAELACDALREIVRQLDEAHELHRSIAVDLQSGRVQDAVTGLSELLATWQTCCQAYRHCTDLIGGAVNRAGEDARPGAEQVAALVSRLREVRDAFESRDFVLLADLLEFELAPLCHSWRDLLSDLADTLSGSRSAA